MHRPPLSILVLLLLSLLWLVPALAASSVAEVEALLAKRDFAQAQTAIEQVLAEHPSSAKAYYLYAQVLQAQGRTPAARAALERAEQLDPALRFANPDYVRRLKTELGQGGTTSPTPTPSTPATPSTPGINLASLLFPLLALGVIVFAVVALIRAFQRRRLMGMSIPHPVGGGWGWARACWADCWAVRSWGSGWGVRVRRARCRRLSRSRLTRRLRMNVGVSSIPMA